jgi:hypothetical protein
MEQHDEILPCTLQNTHIRLLKLETGFSLQKKTPRRRSSLEVGIHEIDEVQTATKK